MHRLTLSISSLHEHELTSCYAVAGTDEVEKVTAVIKRLNYVFAQMDAGVLSIGFQRISILLINITHSARLIKD